MQPNLVIGLVVVALFLLALIALGPRRPADVPVPRRSPRPPRRKP